MAVRLSLAFDASAESRLNRQTRYDLWKPAQHRSELNVKKLSAA